MLIKIIMFLMQFQLNRLRRWQYKDTPYIYFAGTGKDYPKYLMYTDNKDIAKKMHDIY